MYTNQKHKNDEGWQRYTEWKLIKPDKKGKIDEIIKQNKKSNNIIDEKLNKRKLSH